MSRSRHRRTRSPLLPVIAVSCAALALLVAGGSDTFSGWPSGVVTNSQNSTRSSEMAITHTYNSTSCSTTARASSAACAATLGTASSPTASAGVTRTDAIKNNSTVAVSQSVTGVSCAPVQFANSKTSTDPMLPRNGTTPSTSGGPSSVSGSGAVTFDSAGYATGVGSETAGGSPSTLLGLGTYHYHYGYGVWFKTTATNGRLFGLSSNPTSTPASGTTTYDRTLSLTSGKLAFTASGATTATTTSTVNDGTWHYAYVAVEADTFYLLLGLSYTTTVSIYLDGSSTAAVTSTSATKLPTSTGYWSVGGSFIGSLSNFAVYNSTSSPTSSPSSPYAAATELWPLNDNGYTTFTGTLPTAISTPCAKLNITFAFTNPTASIPAQALSSFASGTATAVGAPAIGGTQSLTITITRGAGYTTDIAGLHLYLPLRFTYGVSGATNWVQTFTWANDPLDVFWA